MRKPQNFQWKEMTMGTCYYPEHWDRSLWAQDLQRMLEAGIPESALDAVHMPIGLDIKAETPEEIAVSIAAECILHRATR